MQSETLPAPIDSVLPDYAISHVIGRGATGTLYLAHHERLQRAVAVKQLERALANDPATRQRFTIEAQVLASLNHPHIVPVYDYVERGEHCLLIMEHLGGGTLWERFATGGLTQPEAVATILATCSAMACAHSSGIYHRDIKPENLLFDGSGVVKVADFGMAHVVSGDGTKATRSGEVLGTPAFMAPEQVVGGELGAHTDVYAAGTMLYELLSGQLPFDGMTTPERALRARIERDPIPLTHIANAVPRPIADVTMRAIERESHRRYLTAEQFGVELGIAAASSWGPSWLDVAGIDVQGSPRLVTAARMLRVSGPDGTPTMSDERTVAPAQDTIRASLSVGPMRPASRRLHRTMTSFSPADLVDLSEVVRAFRRPILWYAAAASAVILTFTLAVSRFDPTVDTSIPDSMAGATVNGQPIAGGDPVDLDLRNPIVIGGLDEHNGAVASLTLSAFGVEGPQLDRDRIRLGEVTFDPERFAIVTTGSLDARLELTDGYVDDATSTFHVRATNPWLTSATGIGVLLGLLAALSALDWRLKNLRFQRPRFENLASVGAAGAAVGALAAFASTVIFSNTHSLGSVALTAACAATAACLGGVARSISAVRDRIERSTRTG